jgi:hypothetical protein
MISRPAGARAEQPLGRAGHRSEADTTTAAPAQRIFFSSRAEERGEPMPFSGYVPKTFRRNALPAEACGYVNRTRALVVGDG